MTVPVLYNQKELDKVMLYLSKGNWIFSKELTMKCGINSRQLRQMSESTGNFLGGNEGYKRVDKAEKPEIQHAYNSLMSRSNKIIKRAKLLKIYL